MTIRWECPLCIFAPGSDPLEVGGDSAGTFSFDGSGDITDITLDILPAIRRKPILVGNRLIMPDYEQHALKRGTELFQLWAATLRHRYSHEIIEALHEDRMAAGRRHEEPYVPIRINAAVG
jgi:hypothetical protein